METGATVLKSVDSISAATTDVKLVADGGADVKIVENVSLVGKGMNVDAGGSIVTTAVGGAVLRLGR